MGCLSACSHQDVAAGEPGNETVVPDVSERVVIAHRGASGYLPEHTLPAYALAYASGAHFIEPDLVMTSDGVLMALHDIHLESTTDVEQVFPERKRDDGRWYAADFTWQEISQLSVHERANESGEAVFPRRFKVDSQGFKVPTFRQIVELVQELNRETGCQVGLYPETKDPEFHDREELPLEETLLAMLAEYGYRGRDARVMVQSFSERNLIEMRNQLKTDLPLVQLISEEEEQAWMVTPEGLDKIASYADGIGPSKRLIEDQAGKPAGGRALVEAAHARGLVVHPYTFRADVPAAGGGFEAEVERFFSEYGVDGLFSDHPDQALAAAGVPRRPTFRCSQ
jgi:glycerophosphoryl diester phosphodiesterase